MAFQGGLNSALGKVTGLTVATLIVHLLGSFTVALLLLVPSLGAGNLGKVLQVPWYLFLGGPLGVLIIYGVAASIPKIGVAPATTFIITGQVLTALLLDHLGAFGLPKIPFHVLKLLGVALLAAGASLLLKS